MKVIFYQREQGFEYPIGERIHDNLPAINSMAECLKSLNLLDILLCCQGSSGAIIAGLVAARLPKGTCKICHIKKDGENSHAMGIKHLFMSVDTQIVIIDDFSVTGDTLNRIYKRIKDYLQRPEIDYLCIDYLQDPKHLKFKFKTLIKGTT